MDAKCSRRLCCNVYTVLVLNVCLFPINVESHEPIGTKYFVGRHMTPKEELWMLRVTKICLHKDKLVSQNFKNPQNYKMKSATFFVSLFYLCFICSQNRQSHNLKLNQKRGAKRRESLVSINRGRMKLSHQSLKKSQRSRLKKFNLFHFKFGIFFVFLKFHGQRRALQLGYLIMHCLLSL